MKISKALLPRASRSQVACAATLGRIFYHGNIKASLPLTSCSEWRSVVTREPGFYNYPTVRLHLPTVADGDDIRCITDIYEKDSSATQRLVFSRFDIVELESLFNPGNHVDAYFSLDANDYQQNVGIRAVAKKLIIYTD